MPITISKSDDHQLDALTALPNRILFGDRLRQAMNVSRRQTTSVAVAYIDLDGFKGVNDRLGHNAGDELLRVVSGRMKECIREADTLARIGGDEFVVLLLGVATPQDCEPLLDRLLAACREPVLVSGSVCNVTASIGIALQDHKELNPDALLRRADEAMYRAKEMGKNQYQFATPELN